MTERPKIPEWGTDQLSRLLDSAEFNTKAAGVNFPSIYSHLVDVHKVFQRVGEFLEVDASDFVLLPRMLLIRSHGAFVGAVRLGLAGQLPEASAVERVGIESAWYALHIEKDSNDHARATIWLNRSDSEAARKVCRDEFTIGRVRATHSSFDQESARQLHWVYEQLVDFGGHPNLAGMFGAMSKTETESSITYQVGLLHPEQAALLPTIRLVAAGGIGCLKIAQLLYPERFRLASMDLEIERLVRDLNHRFQPYQ